MRTNEEKKWLQDYNDALLKSVGPTHMVTINFPQRLSGGRATRERSIFIHLREWNREVLKMLFGKQFAARNANDEFLFVGVTEVGPLQQKEHLHLLVRVPAHLIPKFEANAAFLWKPRQILSGVGDQRAYLKPDIVIQRCADHERGAVGAIEYCTKNLKKTTDGLIWSCEFRTAVSKT